MADIRTYAQLADELRTARGPVRLVGIDGCGGAGKTTFAERLSRHGDDWPVVHTDDFATHDEPLEWWPRMLADVIEPLSRGLSATFAPYDWVNRRPGRPTTVAPANVVVVEGVGATRSAWRHRLTLRIWVDTDGELRLRRGLARDGDELAEFWRGWRIAEDRYVAAENPAAYADLIVAGDPSAVAHDPEEEFVVLSERLRAGPGAG
jgi:uridine kinase